MDRLQSLRVFQQVAEEGGFSAAARKLDLPPTAVTRLVSDLERYLGVRLLQRTTRHLSLTPAGASFLSRLGPILMDLQEAERQVRAEAASIDGELRLLAMSNAASHLLASAAAGFQRVHPGVSIEIHVEEAADPPVHKYDLALMSESTRIDPEFIRRPIIRSDFVLCASPSYLARCGVPGSPQELAAHRLLHLRSPAGKAGFLTLRPCVPADNGSVDLEFAPAVESNDIEALLCATLAGAGISAQPAEVVGALEASGHLRRVLGAWRAGNLNLVAVLASRKFIPLRTRTFLDFLVDHAAAAQLRQGEPTKRSVPLRRERWIAGRAEGAASCVSYVHLVS
ncbi:LysR substrate-binding domain-containing protein [Ramlibacter sp. AN1015]|uniref:LysR family transcriptional regulator n=1 Tax=Ramlibacter sp. AN1015 TaxID=3133428 RepID=UPI0030C3B8AB